MNTTKEDNKYISQTKVLLITGMHRSGTSLITRLLCKSGLNVGKKLIGAHTGNMHGHYEDYDFYNFHENILKRNGLNHLVQQPLTNESITSEDENHAKQLIAKRSHYALWGWKDPRTALFLDFWHDVYPDLKFIFIYRHPVDVVLSLLRRGIKLDISVLENQLVGFQSWYVYNQSILNFYKQHPEKSILGNISGIIENVNVFLDQIDHKFGCSLIRTKMDDIYKEDELKQVHLTNDVIEIFDKLAPQAMTVYRELDGISEFPGPQKKYHEGSSKRIQSLRKVIEDLDNASMLEEDQARQLIATIFAIIAPDILIKSRYTIEKYLKDDYSSIESKLINNNNLVNNLRNQSSTLNNKIGQLQDQIKNKNQRIEQLEDQLKNKSLRIEQLQDQLNSKNQRIEQLQDQLKDEIREKEIHRITINKELKSINDRVLLIENSKLFKFNRKLKRILKLK